MLKFLMPSFRGIIYCIKINMSDVFFCLTSQSCLGSPPPKRLFLFGIKKKQKMPAENFSLEASSLAGAVEPEKFVRPELGRTKIQYFGLAGRKCKQSIKYSLLVDY
jgi:hypothetical protein